MAKPRSINDNISNGQPVPQAKADFPAKVERELQERRESDGQPNGRGRLLSSCAATRHLESSARIQPRSQAGSAPGGWRGKRGKNTVIGAYHRNRGFPAVEGRVNTSSRQPVHFLNGSENKPAATFAAFSQRGAD